MADLCDKPSCPICRKYDPDIKAGKVAALPLWVRNSIERRGPDGSKPK